MNNYAPDICFYHDPCPDGFGAAYSIWTRWPECQFIGMSHGETIDTNLIRDKNIMFVDFSVKNTVMCHIAGHAKTIVVLDHHRSAEKELSGFTTFDGSITDLEQQIADIDEDVMKVFVHFDMNHSGAYLAYRFANPNNEVPYAILYIEDADLWNWNMSGSKEFGLALTTEPRDFEYWHENIIPNNESYDLVRQGESILTYQEGLVARIASNAYLKTFVINDFAYYPDVVYCNASVLQSEVGNYLINKYRESPFVVIYYTDELGRTKYSLRSEDGRVDVSEVAAVMGGGGHRNSAGYIS